MQLALPVFKKSFPRYTKSARLAIYYGAKGAAFGKFDEIRGADLVLGLARIPHHVECPFRFLHERRTELAESLGLKWADECAVEKLPRKLPLSQSCKRALARAEDEADRSSSFWIDTDHIQVGLLLEDVSAKAALESIGYDLETTRAAGADCRRRWPMKRPTFKERVQVYRVSFFFVGGLVVAWLTVNLYFLIKNR